MKDVGIVGSGPAGSTLARILAKEGVSVSVFEKSQHPRRKICAGGIPIAALKLLDFDVSSVVEDRINELDFYYKGKLLSSFKSHDTLCITVRRERFDSLLAEKLKASGAELFENEEVTDIEQTRDKVVVTTKRRTAEFRFLVAADGVRSAVVKKAGIRLKRRLAGAFEAEVTPNEETLAKLRGTIRVDFGFVRGGYGWVFPKKNTLSVGIASRAESTQNIFKSFLLYTEKILSSARIREIKSYPIPLHRRRCGILSNERVLCIGDAGNFVDPLSFGGVLYAIKSAYVARDEIMDSLRRRKGLLDFTELVQKKLGFELTSSHRLSNILYYGLPISSRLFLKRRDILRLFCMILKGDSSYSELYGYLKKMVFLRKRG
jgi:geranylgeranyl reductase family protein